MPWTAFAVNASIMVRWTFSSFQGLLPSTSLGQENLEHSYISQPGSRAYDETCTPVAELNFKRFPRLEDDESASKTEQRLWTLACAYADADEEAGEDAESAEAQEELQEEEALEESDSDEDDIKAEVISEDLIEINDGEVSFGVYLCLKPSSLHGQRCHKISLVFSRKQCFMDLINQITMCACRKWLCQIWNDLEVLYWLPVPRDKDCFMSSTAAPKLIAVSACSCWSRASRSSAKSWRPEHWKRDCGPRLSTKSTWTPANSCSYKPG